MNFEQAIVSLKQGYKVARNGWDGPHLVLSSPKSSHFIRLPEALDGSCYSKVTTDLPYILMYTSESKYQPGWTASQEDILSEDWQIV